jgi:hypothetical protein
LTPLEREDEMAVHMVTRVGGEDFRVTLSRDDAGNYVAEAARLPGTGAPGGALPSVRVVDARKEHALASLFDSLHRLTERLSPDGPDAAA